MFRLLNPLADLEANFLIGFQFLFIPIEDIYHAILVSAIYLLLFGDYTQYSYQLLFYWRLFFYLFVELINWGGGSSLHCCRCCSQIDDKPHFLNWHAPNYWWDWLMKLLTLYSIWFFYCLILFMVCCVMLIVCWLNTILSK